jgi:predicted dehydrogenase
MAAYHAKRFSEIAGAEVTAVCDHSEEKAREFAAARGLGRFFTDPSDMAASGFVDAISVAAYDGWHRAPVLAALDRGLPVFCEKPMARRLADAAAMAEAAARAGVPALVNFSKRNGGLLRLARRMIESGQIGTPRTAEFHYWQSWLLQDAWGDWRLSPRWAWRLSESLSTYGALGDLGSHLFDAALLLLGSCEIRGCVALRFDSMGESRADLADGSSYDSFHALIATETAHAAAAGSYRAKGSLDAFGLAIRGDKASIDIDFDRSRAALLRLDAPGEPGSPIEAEKVPSTYERFVAISRGASDPIPGESLDFTRGLEVQGLVEACAVSAEPVEDNPR